MFIFVYVWGVIYVDMYIVDKDVWEEPILVRYRGRYWGKEYIKNFILYYLPS